MNSATTFHVVNYRMQRNEMCKYCADLLYLNFVTSFLISSPLAGDLLKGNAREFFPLRFKSSFPICRLSLEHLLLFNKFADHPFLVANDCFKIICS